MTIDLTQFYDTFFEECLEGLQLMESTLLSVDLGHPDKEWINTIFRVAHSIKGGSATFGFTNIVQFTHVMETLLDKLREAEIVFTAPMVTTLLSSVDALVKIIHSFKRGNYQPSLGEIQALELVLRGYLIASEDKTFGSKVQPHDHHLNSSESSRATVQYREGGGESTEHINEVIELEIDFVPQKEIFLQGYDPVTLFKRLEAMGDLSVRVNVDGLPPLSEMSAKYCYCQWRLSLKTQHTVADIEKAFEWYDEVSTYTLNLIPKSDPEIKSTEVTGMPVASAQVNSIPSAKKLSRTVTTNDSVRVSLEKMDDILNSVGELVITQLMLFEMCQRLEPTSYRGIQPVLKQLATQTRHLQEGVMGTRMLPLSTTFNRFVRMIHDLSESLGKKIHLSISGESTELDKTVIEKITDPLVHLIRNAVDHGIESPEVRTQKGKPIEGQIRLHAFQQGSDIYIEMTDDGKGIDTQMIRERAIEKGMLDSAREVSEEELYNFIFYPGFSTAQVVSEISGRGVGMDIVKRNILSIGGNVKVESQMDVGTRILIKLPLTLAIMDGQLCKVSGQTFIIPMLSIIESVPVTPGLIKQLPDEESVFIFRENFLPVIDLRRLFQLPETPGIAPLLVVIESTDGEVGILVDELTSQQQIVIKNLEANYQRVAGLSGATILGTGKVALILDLVGLIEMAKSSGMLSVLPFSPEANSA